MSLNRDEIIACIADVIWTELEQQAERFGWINRDAGVIDIGAGELSMTKVAEAVLLHVIENDDGDIRLHMNYDYGEE